MAVYEDAKITNLRVDKLQETSVPYDFEFTIGTEAGNVINVAAQAVKWDTTNVEQALALEVWLSDSSDGSDVVTTAPSGTVVIGTNGSIINSYTAKKHFKILSSSTGSFDLNITEAGAKTLYVAVQNPLTGKVEVSSAVTFA